MWLVNFFRTFWQELTVSYKDLPNLDTLPPSGHGEWKRTREPEPMKPIIPAEQGKQTDTPPAVQIQPVHIVSARERSTFHKMRLEALQDTSWLTAGPVDTGPIPIADVPTQPVERNTEVTSAIPSVFKLLHETRNR